MTETATGPATAGPDTAAPLIEMTGVGKFYGAIRALEGINLKVDAGEITCVLGDNGAGKSTLIKIMSGLHQHSEGIVKVHGEEVKFDSPRDALAMGIATVYQDLAVVSLMEVWRNFFLGSEKRRRYGLINPLAIGDMRSTAKDELAKMGINLKDINQPIGTLSGGQRQCVAIARAVYFGARVLILDEPTAALGVKQSGVVLKYTARARDAGLGVVFITHNPHHAYLVGDHFVVLKLGQMILDAHRDEINLADLTSLMAGGEELETLSHELAREGAVDTETIREIEVTERAAEGPVAEATPRATGNVPPQQEVPPEAPPPQPQNTTP
jgi:simple sugar transport system ATP-binding protein